MWPAFKSQYYGPLCIIRANNQLLNYHPHMFDTRAWISIPSRRLLLYVNFRA